MTQGYEYSSLGGVLYLMDNGIFVIVDWGGSWQKTAEPLENVFPDTNFVWPEPDDEDISARVLDMPFFEDPGDFLIYIYNAFSVQLF